MNGYTSGQYRAQETAVAAWRLGFWSPAVANKGTPAQSQGHPSDFTDRLLAASSVVVHVFARFRPSLSKSWRRSQTQSKAQ